MLKVVHLPAPTQNLHAHSSVRSALSAFVAALCIMQFTYTFPPLLMLGFSVQRDAIIVAEGEGFDPTTGRTIRSDSGVRRWIRGFLAGRWYVKVFNCIVAVGALVTAGLGMYSSIEGIVGAFKGGRNTAFSCRGPV
jgi:hypothetical protein